MPGSTEQTEATGTSTLSYVSYLDLMVRMIHQKADGGATVIVYEGIDSVLAGIINQNPTVK